ncbi:MAG TPA: hypothetical protein PKI49_11250, partial [Pseudomonadota bacterium]|nr:hypothetical protein [Pseudomonadota bacterium]
MQSTFGAHTHKRLGTLLGSLGALLLSSQTASAQQVQEAGFTQPTYNMQLFRPAIDSKGYVTLNASQVLGHKDFSLGLVGTWAGKPLYLEVPAGSSAPFGPVSSGRTFEVSNLVTAQLQFALGLFKHFEIALGIPLSIMTGGRQVCPQGQDC